MEEQKKDVFNNDDLPFVCYMLEKLSRKMHLSCEDIALKMGNEALNHHLRVAEIECSINQSQLEAEWINNYKLEQGNYDIFAYIQHRDFQLPSAITMGWYYGLRIGESIDKDTDYADAIIRYFKNPEFSLNLENNYILAERLCFLFYLGISGKVSMKYYYDYLKVSDPYLLPENFPIDLLGLTRYAETHGKRLLQLDSGEIEAKIIKRCDFKKVFISGSRSVSVLSKTVKEELESIVSKRFTVLIGDCYGADEIVQQYLADIGYDDVVVCAVNGKARNNKGAWKIESVYSNYSKYEYYKAKDIAMAKQASCGIAIWDGKSKGTFDNITNLISLNKAVTVFTNEPDDAVRIVSKSELDMFIKSKYKGK